MKKNPTKITEKTENNRIHILVFRFSSMGDVALTAPVLKGILQANDNTSITLATRPLYKPFFENIPGLDLFLCDFKAEYKGLPGLIRLFHDLKGYKKFDYVLDLHDVLRTWILGGLFRLSGYRVKVLDKGRREKEELVKGRSFTKLKSMTERYAEVFSRLDFSWEAPHLPVINPGREYLQEAENYLKTVNPQFKKQIGLAPFALHKLKTWPESHTLGVLKIFEKRQDVAVFLFGGGPDEEKRLNAMADEFQHCYSMAGKISLGAELALMQKMDFMITMDSANMHLSALVGVKTVTLWGATHPYAGFEAFQQKEERNIQIPKEDLACRPCTVFGKGECRRGDFACMQWLTPDVVYNRLINLGLIDSTGKSRVSGD